MITELLSPDFIRELVINAKLSLDGSTGTKKRVQAYFVSFQGILQVHFKYGDKFYRFNVKQADDKEKKYNEIHNLR